MQRQWLNHAVLRLRLKPREPILVKSGTTSPLAEVDDSPIMTRIHDSNGREQFIPFIPGTSLKGVLRSHFERLARTISIDAVCEVFGKKCCSSEYLPIINNLPKYDEETEISESALRYQYSCPSCKTFGSLIFAGRMNISDAYPDSKHMPDSQGEIRDGVGIDRVTGGTFGKAKFQYQVVVGGEYLTEISITNFELWQLGLWGVFMSDSVDGMISVGSGSSRGFGRIEIMPDDREDQPCFELSFPRSYEGISEGKIIRGMSALSVLSDPQGKTMQHYGLEKADLDEIKVAELPDRGPSSSGMRETWGYSSEKTVNIFNNLGEVLFKYLHRCPAWNKKTEEING
jgi:CRISPR-associated RAMP protein (TIGR02581 family)